MDNNIGHRIMVITLHNIAAYCIENKLNTLYKLSKFDMMDSTFEA